jgi:hypothetical protein
VRGTPADGPGTHRAPDAVTRRLRLRDGRLLADAVVRDLTG